MERVHTPAFECRWHQGHATKTPPPPPNACASAWHDAGQGEWCLASTGLLATLAIGGSLRRLRRSRPRRSQAMLSGSLDPANWCSKHRVHPQTKQHSFCVLASPFLGAAERRCGGGGAASRRVTGGCVGVVRRLACDPVAPASLITRFGCLLRIHEAPSPLASLCTACSNGIELTLLDVHAPRLRC